MIQVAVMETSSSFGEAALINKKPRGATIRCLEPCFMAVLSKEDYQKSLGKIQKQQVDTMINFLSSMPQFGGPTK